VIKAIKEKFASWILEILIVVFTTIGSFIWGLHVVNAEQNMAISRQEIEININEKRIINLENIIESLRKENREDHKEILLELKDVVKNLK